MTLGLPADFRLTLDPGAWLDGDDVLLGGTPFRIVRLSPAQTDTLAGWIAGKTVGDDEGDARFARALVAGGFANPVPPTTSEPRQVSVVIPVRDRPRQLDRLLRTIRALEASDPVAEVVVVDDASTDSAAHEAVAREHGAQLVRRAARGRAGAARNDGARLAVAEVVAFVDSDCVPRAGWLSGLLSHFTDPLVAAVAPRIVALQSAQGSGWIARYEVARSPMDRGPSGSRVVPGGRVPFVPGAALLVRASALGDGFDESLHGGEDVDIVWRLTREGWHVRYEPAGEVEHEHRTTTAGFLRRRAYYGRTAAPLSRRHPRAARPLAVSPWTAAAWAAVGARRPVVGAAITAVASGLLARQLQGIVEQPVRAAVRLAGGGTLRSGLVVADSVVRAWWPLSLVAAIGVRRLRPALGAAAVVPAVLEWRRLRPEVDPVRWTAARMLDDVAYGWGVWQGCLRERTADPLLPELSWRLRIERPPFGEPLASPRSPD